MNTHKHRSVSRLARQLLAGAIAGASFNTIASEPLPEPARIGNGSIVSRNSTPVVVEAPPLPPLSDSANNGAYDCDCECLCGHSGRRLRHHGKTYIPVRPFGTYVRAGVAAQIENGVAAQLVLYHYDFVAADGQPGMELNLRGQARLEKLMCLTELVPCPLIIELDEKNPLLNAARRAHVIEQVQQVAVNFPAERIVIGRPAARGISGDEAVAIQRIVQEQVQTMGGLESFSAGRMTPFGGAPGGSGATGAAGGGSGQGR